MSPPVSQAIPRFVADAPQEALPYGRWAERLVEQFTAACERIEDLPAGVSPPREISWFPERGWGGRVYVPATASVSGDSPGELFGHVSFERPESGEPGGFRATADFTDITAEQNPGWKIDLNDDVVGSWRGEMERSAEMTLVWGTPLVPGAVAATAELAGEVVDQTALVENRFTLVAIDDVRGYGDELYLEVKLWNQRADELAAESLYDDPESPDSSARIERLPPKE
jgi:hypothetical protein